MSRRSRRADFTRGALAGGTTVFAVATRSGRTVTTVGVRAGARAGSRAVGAAAKFLLPVTVGFELTRAIGTARTPSDAINKFQGGLLRQASFGTISRSEAEKISRESSKRSKAQSAFSNRRFQQKGAKVRADQFAFVEFDSRVI